MSLLLLALIALTLTFAFVSADVAAEAQLQDLRMIGFIAVTAILAVVTVLARPVFDARLKLLPLALLGLLAVIGFLDARSTVSPADYRIVLPILALLIAPNLADQLRERPFVGMIAAVLGAYAVLTFVAYLAPGDTVIVRGHGAQLRFDVTGSVIGHSSLCVIQAVLAACLIRPTTNTVLRGALVLSGLAALAMVFLTGTRTAIVTLGLFALFALITTPNRIHAVRAALAAATSLVLLLTLYTIHVSDNFTARLLDFGNQAYTSGRWDSIVYWLGLTREHPLGLGFGYIRDALSHGRPFFDGSKLLEWPHNEFVRYYVEAGPFGLAFAALLVGGLIGLTLRAARHDPSGPRRALCLIIVSDLTARMLLQNYLNNVYHSTALILVLAVCLNLARRRDIATASDKASPWQALSPRAASP